MIARQAFAVALAWTVVASGCGTALEPRDIYGRYVCRYPYGIEVLLLRKEGTYFQLVDIDNRPGPSTHEGRWSYDAKSHEVSIFAPLAVDNGFGMAVETVKEEKGAWTLSVDRSRSEVRMRFNPDFDFEFRKIK